MPRNITVTFSDGTSHVYENAPDDITPDMVTARARKDFNKSVIALDGGRRAAPATISEIPSPRQEESWYSQVRPYVAPVVETLGGVGGSILGGTAGTFGAGPIGTVAGGIAGAGLGYAAAKEALELADVYFGNKPPRKGTDQITQPLKNIAEGAAFEAGGRAAVSAIGGTVKGVKRITQKVAEKKAANITKQALRSDLPDVVNALRTAPPGTSVAEATAFIKNPAWQALVKDSLESTPKGAQYLNKLKFMNEEEGVNALAKIVGGKTATEARAAAEAQKRVLTETTKPMREAVIEKADIGQDVVKFSREAGRLEAEAAEKVEEVRRLMAAGETAEKASQQVYKPLGQPRAPGQYTYPGELAIKADEWATAAARGSLDAGEAARQANAAVKSLTDAGFKPLKTVPLIEKISAIGKNPDFAANDVMQAAVKNLQNDLAQWTNVHGIIPAAALDAIRKNSVNAAVRDVLKNSDPSTQAKAAASAMTNIKPLLIDAMEEAGGKGYREYLEAYAQGAQKIAEKKLSGEALRLWKNDKDGFINLVNNESPDVVEEFLGPGKYNIAMELADSTMEVLRTQAQKAMNRIAASEQASQGQKALAILIQQNTSMIRLPSFLTFWIATANKGLQTLQSQIGKNTTKVLSEAMQNPSTAADLISSLSKSEQQRVMKIITNPTVLKPKSRAFTTGVITGVNALASDNNVENQLVR